MSGVETPQGEVVAESRETREEAIAIADKATAELLREKYALLGMN